MSAGKRYLHTYVPVFSPAPWDQGGNSCTESYSILECESVNL